MNGELALRYHHAPGRGLILGAGLLGAGLLGLLAAGYGLGWLTPRAFFGSWLLGCAAWLNLALGAMAVFMIHQLTGGHWGEALKPPLQAAMGSLPLLALLFIPVAFGMEAIFPWAGEAASLPGDKGLYLNRPFQLGRLAGYWVVWLSLILALGAWRAPRAGSPYARWAGAGLPLYGLTVTFYAVDWIMALEPHFYSTIFGFLVMASQATGGLALGVLAMAVLAGPAVTLARLNDQGNLLLAALLFWTYLFFMQYLIIWSTDLPHEILWYLHRNDHGWQYVTLLLVSLHCLLPFGLLLSVGLKRSRRAMAGIALVVLLAQFTNIYWWLAPAFHPQRAWPGWSELAAWLGVGGLWLAGFMGLLRRYPPVREAL